MLHGFKFPKFVVNPNFCALKCQ